MALDKWIAALFLAGSVVYGIAAFNYPLLPFERNMPFLPSTLPMVLSVLAALLSLVILVSPRGEPDEKGDVLGSIDLKHFREYKVGQALMLISAMILYALALRPIGFLAATTLFLAGTGWILGERKYHILIPVALVGAGSVWYLVQEALGIFLRPLPWFMA